MALKIPDAFRQTRADTLPTRAGNAALLRIYSGSQPADADTAASGTLLAELTCGSPFAGAASSEGVSTANAITQDSSANATGTAGYFRLVQSNGTTVVCDGTVTATGGGGQMELVTTSITSGQPVQISAFTWTEGGA
jgi:hypothetical protein